ncbi:transglycosylase family protein [Streptomyces sp. NPDC046215]|uniref:transglycosylase family protein n=1 Tax=Streptomyces TaxID=1883 RepID=UPI0031DEE122
MTGSALAMPLLAATGASAADAPTWDRVAQCESGGLWSANKGNGSYGGLQLTQELWEQNGGRAYAPRPDLASRSQQIAVAEKILGSSGTGAWQGCAATSGLDKGGKAPEVNPGSTVDPKPSATTPRTPEPEPSSPASPSSPAAPSSPATPSAPPSASPSAPSSPAVPSAEPSATPGGPSAPVSPSPSEHRPGTPESTPSAPAAGEQDGRHRKGGPADDPTEIPTAPAPSADAPSGIPSGTPGPDAPGDPATGTDGTGKHRAQPPRSDDGRPSRGGADARPGVPATGDYTVRDGDNLSVIAEKHSVTGGWQSLYERNEKAVGSDPDLIHPGQKLEIGK